MSDNHGVECGSPDESCSCGLGGVVKRDTLTKCENAPDLLALEAENKRLRGALDLLINSFIDLRPVGEPIDCHKYPGYLKALETLTTPPPETSALWGVLAKAELLRKIVYEEKPASYEWVKRLDNASYSVAVECNTITPEQRALIEEMAELHISRSGGQSND